MTDEAWCPNCARPGRPLTVTPARAWIAGALGCVGSIALMVAALFVVSFIVLTAMHATEEQAYTATYGMTTSIGLAAPALAALIIGGILLHSQRRRVCPSCRAAYPR